MENFQWGQKLLHLQTNKVVKWRNLTKIPIKPRIIKEVHALSTLDNMPQGLKIKNQANNVILDSDWIAGVDYDEAEFDNDKYYDKEEWEDNDNNKNNNKENYKY